MTAIRHTLQRDVFLPNDERLIGVVHVSKAGKKKKVSFLCATVTTDQPAQVFLHKVKKTDKDAFKKRQSWPLAELKICDGKDPKTDVPDFDLHFEKVYRWIASNVAEKNAFISSLWKLSQRYLKQLKKPDFINVKPALLEEYLSLEQAKVHVAQSEDELSNEDYQALSGREETDLERMMAECEFAIGNAEAFIERLANDLSVLDGANIHSIIESQQEVARLMFLLDDSLREVNKVESSLDEYDKMLEGVRVHMEIMEQKDSMIQIQSQNHGQLLTAVETIMQKLDMPHQQQLALLDRDLGSPKGIMDCTAAAQVLQEKMDAELLPGLGKMRAVVEQRELLTNLQEKFAQRLAIHLNNIFIQQGADMSEMMLTLGNRLTLPKHFTFHRDLIPYAELMQWLRKADRTSFQQLGKIYTDNLKKVYERELKDFFERARQAVMMKGKTTDIKKFGLKGDKGSSTPEPSRSGTRTKASTLSLQEFSANLKAAETDLNEKQKFDMVFTQLLNEIQPMCNSEQDFCTKFFGYGLDTEGMDAEYFPMADQVDGGTFSRYRKQDNHEERKGVAFALNPDLSDVDGKMTTHGMRKVMGELFQCLEPEFKSFVTFSERMDNFNSVYMLVRISPHVMSSETQAKSASYFSIIMANCLVEVKRNFDKYMDNLIRSVEETRISKKSKCGILPFVKEFETFACQAESVFKGSDLRGNLDKAYSKLVLAQFRNIHRVALEHQKTPSDVIIFENFHHLHDVLSRLKITCLESERKEAKQQYQDHLQSYVRDSLGRPMEKLNHFFEGIQVLVSQGVKEEEVGYQIQFSKQELRKIIKEYPQKEVKKNLESLIKKVEKTLCEEENLVQVVWRMMQEDFLRQYKHIETMIGRCYPGSKISLEFTIQDVLQFFTDIAQSH